MTSPWHIVAFPVILPWREEFWTLPLYFPDLKVGVIPGWPTQLPYQGLPLPPEAEVHPRELNHYQPGDLRQWQAFEKFRGDQQEESDSIIQDLRYYGDPAAPETPPPPPPDLWSLAWQLEKMQADQEAQLLMVDRGDEWLRDIFKTEPWGEPAGFGEVPGVEEIVDPELARLRYRLWRRTLAPDLQEPAAPLLLGRTSRSLFLTLKGWPEWTGLQTVALTLPGCRTQEEWRTVAGGEAPPPWQPDFRARLAALLAMVAQGQDPREASREMQEFVHSAILPSWPLADPWQWQLEVWVPKGAPDKEEPVLCWTAVPETPPA